MSDAVRFAIVGLGMGRGRAGVCAKTAGAKLVAVCDGWEERGAEAAKTLGVEWVRDFDRLLERRDIDVIGLWTPSGMHSTMAAQVLDAGKHVCVTKPMDIHLAACDKAIEAARRNGKILAVDFELRYDPLHHRIAAAVATKAIGEIVMADLRMKWFRAQLYYDSGNPAGWRSRLATESGSVANQAVHYLDLVQWWLGPVARVVGASGTFGHRIETEDATQAIIQFRSGVRASMMTTTCAFPDAGTVIELTGTAGTIVWRSGKLESFKAAKAAEGGQHADVARYETAFQAKPEPIDLAIDGFRAPEGLPRNIFEDMVGAVRDGKPVQCDGAAGRVTVAIFEAVYESSRRKAWVDLA